MKEYEIRRMTLEEVDSVCAEWAYKEGWNPGLNDAGCFYNVDPRGFFAGELDGEIIASISAVAYDTSFGFIGFYIVKPEYRGRGYGKRIWDEALSYLLSRNIGLDGVPDQQDNYRKSGFSLAYSNIRYEGISKKTNLNFELSTAYDPDYFNAVGDFDKKFFPVGRNKFLEDWFGQENAKTWVELQDGIIKGFATIRKCRKGYKMGPLFSEDVRSARRLLQTCFESIESGMPVYLDVPEVNPEAVALAEEFAMNPVFHTARMYTRSFPEINTKGIYGVTSFELG